MRSSQPTRTQNAQGGRTSRNAVAARRLRYPLLWVAFIAVMVTGAALVSSTTGWVQALGVGLILLPLLCALAGIFFGLSVACLGFVVGGSFLLFNLLPFGWHGVMGNSAMQLLVALGLISGAIGGGALLLLLMDVIAKLLIRYARLHFRLFDTANKLI